MNEKRDSDRKGVRSLDVKAEVSQGSSKLCPEHREMDNAPLCGWCCQGQMAGETWSKGARTE